MLSFIKTIFKILSIFAFAFLLAGWPLTVMGTDPAGWGSVNATRLHLRERPEGGAPSIAILTKGARVRIIEQYENWLKITHKGKTGFVSRRYIRTATQAPPGKDSPPIPESPPQNARQIESQLTQKIEAAAAFTQKEAEIIDSLDQIDKELNRSEQQAALLGKTIGELAAAIKANETAAGETEQAVAQLEGYAAKRLAALYKLSRLGTTSLMASAESLFELLARKKMLQELLAHDESTWQTLVHKRATLAALQKTLGRQRQAHLVQTAILEEKIQVLSKRRSTRSALLAKIRKKRSLTLAAIAALQKAAEGLDRQINTTVSPPPVPPAAQPAPEPPFHEFKGLLNMPVSGTIISFFGPYTSPHLKVSGFRSGIDIEADRGEPIRAVKGGTALYAGWFKGYGNMVILDHGDHFCTVYAHAQEIFKKKGEAVEPGEVIATVGDTGSLQGPKLHFEIRHHGKPVDPLKWIEKRSKNNHDKNA